MIRSAKQTGYILLPVIVVITLVAAIALLMNTESALESNTAATELDAQQAQYVAGAGMNHALWLAQQQGCGVYSDLTGVSLGNDQYTTILTTDLGSTTSYSITVDQDSWIRNDQPTINKATDLKLHTRFETGNIERPLLRYDLSSIPANSKILSATAWFFVTNVHPEGPVDIHVSTTDWLETDATWDSMGDKIDKVVMSTIPPQATANVWVSANLTSQVQAWVNGQTNYGITLNSTSEGSHGQYNSIESANPPYLEVIVGGPPTSPATLKAAGTLANGTTRSITRDDVILNQQPQSFAQVRVTPGTGKDAVLDSFYNNRNHGDYRLDVDSVGTLEHVLIQFDVPAIPPGARILSARLGLYHTITNGTPVNPGIDIHRVTRDWIEGTMSGTGTADGATWDTWDGSNTWTQAGGDFDIAPVASDSVSAAIIDWESWEIGELVQGWIDDTYPNYGLLLKGTGSIDVSFASKEDADPELHPRLLITYACACGEICVTPQGSGNLLMVVINPTTLVAEDQQGKDLFESWGYTVSVIGESANQTSYDAAVAINDVVFISETVNSNSVGTKLVDAPIGVVSQDGDYNPDLGLATGSTLKVGTDIDITSTDHYITRVFPVGPLPIYAADMEQLVTSGALTADQQSLAEIGGDASLVVLDKGDAMEGGGNAVGRRVVLPLGTRYRFNWDYLNANGRVLVQRALTWGMGEITLAKPKILLVVGDEITLASRDTGRRNLMESWGYEVSIIDDNAAQADFDSKAAAVDVVYVSGTVSGPSLLDKLTGSPTPIVNEINGKLDNFGFSSSTSGSVTASAFSVTNASHYISEPFAGNPVTFFTTGLAMPVPGGTLAPDLQTVGETAGSTPALVTLDTAATRWDGNPAPARRVHLPFTNAETSQLTVDGETLMKRAIEWAGGAGCVSLKPLLLVVGDATTLSSKDSGMKSLIQSWCYAVSVIDDGASQASFDAAAAAADVVYVSGTTSGPSLQDKLTGSPTPIVNEINGKLDNFGFSSSTGSSVTASAFSATSGSHYISEPFAGGPVTFFTTDLAMPVPGGTLAPDLQTVGETTGAIPALVTLDSGAQRWDATPAPARRVHLPFTNAETSQLTADGETLMRRSLEWAASTAAASCDTDYTPDTKLSEFSTSAYGSNNIQGMTYLPAGTSFNGVAAPADGAWISVNYADGRFYMTDMVGNYLTDLAPPIGAPTGVAYVASGTWADHLAVINQSVAEIQYYDLNGTLAGSFSTIAIGSAVATGVTFIGTTSGGVYDDHLAISDSNADRVFLVTQGGTLISSFDTLSFSLRTNDLAHMPGSDKLLLLDRDAIAFSVDFSGTVLGQYDVAPFGITVPEAVAINTVTCDHVVGDDTPDLVVTLNQAGGGGGPGYTELYQTWSATNDDTWQTVGLGAFGVPANAVVEVAIVNSDAGKEYFGGVRTVGSALERRFQLHEAEGGGVDTVTLHVQADASSQIQHYSDKSSRVSFILLGYWTGAVYVERFDAFKAGASASWQTHNLGAYGVGLNQVAEIALSQTSTSAEWQVGLRRSGSSQSRQVTLHEAEAGGIDMVSMLVESDASSLIEVYAQSDSVVDFHLLGYWSTPPGTYTETGGVQAQALSASTWELTSLAGFGVPADSVAQFVISNQIDNFSRELGVREVGSGNNRVVELQEAESGGGDLGTMHVNVDSASSIEWYSASGTSERFFYPVGWWVLSP